MLIHEDLAALLFVIFLNAHNKIVRAFLNGDCKSVCQVNVDLVAHVLCEHGRVLFQSCLELALFSCMELILVIANFELVVEVVVQVLQSEFLLVNVGLGDEREIHVGHLERAHALLFEHVARLSLDPHIEIKHHRHACHSELNYEVRIALIAIFLLLYHA